MKASIHQFWNDRVRECMQDGLLKDLEVTTTNQREIDEAYRVVTGSEM